MHIENIETLSYFDKLIDNYSIIKEIKNILVHVKDIFIKKIVNILIFYILKNKNISK